MDFLRGRTEMSVQPLQPDDLRAAADIHAESFARGWTDGEIERLLARPGTFGLVVRPVGRKGLAGFILYTLAAGEAEILTVATAAAWRRHGAGAALVKAALLHMNAERAEAMFLEVEEENAPAVSLYRKLGFREVGHRKDYYGAMAASRTGGKSAGALVMRRDLA
ncbi:MAG: GNAT family N-acetyltransferase [Rhizobiaceae bacterium]|nr:GNAT family N-acetyltransferase [Rhizobiaceae bacterium]